MAKWIYEEEEVLSRISDIYVDSDDGMLEPMFSWEEISEILYLKFKIYRSPRSCRIRERMLSEK